MNIQTRFKWAAIMLLFCGLVFTACSKSEDKLPTVKGNETLWKLGPYTYYANIANRKQVFVGNAWDISTSTDGAEIENASDYGEFAGSGVAFFFPPDLGEGSYKLCNDDELNAHLDAKYMLVRCVIGTLSTIEGVTTYRSSLKKGGTAMVTKDEKGLYHISITKTVTLTQDKNRQGQQGVKNAKDAYTFLITNAY